MSKFDRLREAIQKREAAFAAWEAAKNLVYLTNDEEARKAAAKKAAQLNATYLDLKDEEFKLAQEMRKQGLDVDSVVY